MDEASTSLHKKQYYRDALDQKIEFYRHNLTKQDKDEALAILDSIFLTTGKTVALFEEKFARYMKSRFAVGVMSCTHALELALRYYNIGPGDEVITTPLSFVASANAVEYVGAKPVFIDVEASTGNIDASRIEHAITQKTRAILVVHLYGQMCDMRAIKMVADRYNLKIIEDCAHCIEGVREGIRPGQLGDIACYSFYATKNITCGEGGAITCNDPAIYEWMLMARSHGITKSAADRYIKKYEHYDMEFLGMKCNMSNISAALLLHQIDRMDEILKKKEHIAKRFDEAFRHSKALRVPARVPGATHAWHLYTIWVDSLRRDQVMHYLQDSAIGVAVNFRPIHLMSYYRKKYGYIPGSFPHAERIGAETVTLPFYSQLTEDEIQRIIKTVLTL